MENYTTQLKKIKEDMNKWKYILCPWIGKLNVAKKAILLKAIYRLNVFPIKFPKAFLFQKWKSLS